MSYRPENIVRWCIALVGFFGVLFAPWWVPLLCMLALSLRFSAWEVPLIGLCIDLMWLPWGAHIPLPIFSIVGIVLVWAAAPLRRQLLV